MDIAREIAAVLVVFGLLGAFLLAGRRLQWVTATVGRPRGGKRRLELLDSLRIGPQQAIHLVRVDSKTMVISVHGSGCTLLREEESEAVK